MMIPVLQWTYSAWWLVLLFLFASSAFVVYRIMRIKKTVRLLTSTRLARTLLVSFSWPKVIIRSVLLGLVLIFLSLALLRPQICEKEETIKQQGRDLLIALDISRSMLAEDVKPSRLEAAKKKIEYMVRSLHCERVGLLLFSGSALVQCPLTADHEAFFMFLHDVDGSTIASGSTAIDQALLKALDVYAQIGDRKHKMVVLFTDGEDFSSSLVRIRERAKQQGLTIFTMGVGSTQGAPVPLIDDTGRRNGFVKDARGTIVISRRNDGILQTLAEDAGGVYIPMTSDIRDCDTLIAQVTAREKELLGEKKLPTYSELYPYACVLSVILLLLEWIL